MARESAIHPAKNTVSLWLQRLSLIGVILATPFLFWGGPDCGYCHFYQAVWNLGHPLLFGLIMLASRPWRYSQGWRLWLITTFLVFTFGSLIEYLQGLVGRDVDIDDVYRDLIGAWFILAWQPYLSDGQPGGQSAVPGLLTRLIATSLIVLELISVARTGFQQWKIDHQLPSLYDFQQPGQAFEWQGNITPTRSSDRPNYYPLLVQLKPGHYPSVFLEDMPHNWSGYKHLEISLFNPGNKALSLTLRINDAQHDTDGGALSDRFNHRLIMQPGQNQYSIPLAVVKNAPRTREMDMKQITRLGIFATNLGTPAAFYIQNLKLVR